MCSGGKMFDGLKSILELIKNVTWREIEEAKKLGELVELEHFIYEETTIEEYERDIEENIMEALKEEGLYDPEKMGWVVVPAGAIELKCEKDKCYYSAGFEVFDKTGWHVIARGTAYGTIVSLEGLKKLELQDLTVVLTPENAEKLKKIVEAK